VRARWEVGEAKAARRCGNWYQKGEELALPSPVVYEFLFIYSFNRLA